jgi:hypothetical protein
MRSWKFLALPVLAAAMIWVATPTSPAQVAVSVGVAPACPYGYYSVPPYNCAPFGYYGPEWFSGGVFIGAGPWYHGPEHFYGHVDNHFDPNHGYHGPYPARGEHADPQRFAHHAETFHGNEMRDGRGHVR